MARPSRATPENTKHFRGRGFPSQANRRFAYPLQAANLEDQREYLDYLNSILRHEVLNTATIINGYASLLETEATGLTEQQCEWAQIVIDESEELTTVIDDVRVLLQATEGANRLEPVNAARVLETELSKLDRRFESVDVVDWHEY